MTDKYRDALQKAFEARYPKHTFEVQVQYRVIVDDRYTARMSIHQETFEALEQVHGPLERLADDMVQTFDKEIALLDGQS